MFLANFLFLSLFVTFISADECGESQLGTDLSVGGEYSTPGQFPWLAPLFYKEAYQCGSSIISRNRLLTAAHCLVKKGVTSYRSPADFYALLGRYDLNNNNEINSIRRVISEIFVHPDWKPFEVSYDADIAVLAVASKINFNDFIQPICLPSSSERIFDIEGTVAGYGYSGTNKNRHENRPKHVQIKSAEHAVCLFKEYEFARISSLRMFCAGRMGENPCKGDSGSPFMVQLNNKWTITGIASATTNRECHENDFVLFTQVPVFINWIKDPINEHPLKCEFTWHDDHNRYECYSTSFKIFAPNQRVTSILGEIPDTKYDFSNIETIVIKDSAQVSFMPDFSIANRKFPNFKRLFLTKVGLKEVDKEMLALLPQLTVFNVFGNQIKEFQENVFDDLVNLEVLAFVKNQIKVLPQKLLWKLPNLKELWAWDNQIEAIPPRFFKINKKIEKLYLNNNKISTIDAIFRGLPKLSLIDLRSNVCIDKKAESDFNELQSKIEENC